jgi:formylmethanofuran dehydrogenase subunit E
VSKNGPCWVDAVALMTGARINFKTLRIDNSIGNGFVIQRISTGEAYDVRLKDGVFPAELAALEKKIRRTRAQGKPVTAEVIDRVERIHNELIKKLLTTDPAELVIVRQLDDYRFDFSDLYGERGDVINKNMPRK